MIQKLNKGMESTSLNVWGKKQHQDVYSFSFASQKMMLLKALLVAIIPTVITIILTHL